MNDLIERQAAIDLLDENDPMLRTREYYRKMIAELPSVTPQQKVGGWKIIKNVDGNLKTYVCSECGALCGYKQKYCEKCGAKMEV